MITYIIVFYLYICKYIPIFRRYKKFLYGFPLTYGSSSQQSDYAGAAEHLLWAGVVLARDHRKPVPDDEPAGEGAGRLLDVFLGVRPRPRVNNSRNSRAVVLVRLPPAVFGRMEPDQHGRPLDDGGEHLFRTGGACGLNRSF